MADKNLYINDLIHREATWTFIETANGSETNVQFKNGSTIEHEASNLDVVDAYRTIRADYLNAEVPKYLSTTTERDALTNTETGTEIDNITVGRNEIYDGTTWKPVNRRKVTTSITASTTQTQGNGLLSADLNIIATVANNNDTVTLPTAVPGTAVIIVNKGTKKIKIFPNTGDDLGEGVNSSVSLSAGSSIIFYCYDTTNWESA